MYEPPETIIAAELSPDEKLLWAGRPPLGLRVRAGDAFLIPFSLLWGGFAIFWEVGVIATGAPWFFAIWGVPFVLIGLYMIVGRFFFDARSRESTLYAVTSERIIIISGVFRREVKSLSVETLTDLSLTEGRNGSGIIEFGAKPFWYTLFGYSLFAHSSWPGASVGSPYFELAENARQVYETIRTAQRAAKQSYRAGDTGGTRV